MILWNSDAKMPMERQDVISYPVPMTSLARTINPKLTRLITNMIYVGALAELLAIDDAILKRAVARQFNGKASAIELNSRALDLGRDHVESISRSRTRTLSRHGMAMMAHSSSKGTKQWRSVPSSAAFR